MPRIKATSRTIACTLSEDDLEDAGAAWHKLSLDSLISRDLIPGGLRLTVRTGAEDALRQLVDLEAECCRRITFDLDGPSVTMTGDGPGEQAIQSMWAAEPPA
jgi:hypothetical protein